MYDNKGNKSTYHMTFLLFNGYRHVINNVMTIRYITLSVGTSNIMTTSVTTIQFIREIRVTREDRVCAISPVWSCNITRVAKAYVIK